MRKLIRLLIRLCLFAFVVIAGIATVKTIAFSSKQIPVNPVETIMVKEDAAQRLAEALAIPTIAQQGNLDSLPFFQLDTFIQLNYPNVDSILEKTRIGTLALFYKWPGKNPKLPPILLMAHQDVVPAEPSTLDDWTKPAFGGKISDGFIWGRGALDDKSSLFSILEAVEMLIKEGYQPERSIYLAFGHDEEVGGQNGAVQIADYCQKEGIQFDYVLDEGQIVLNNALGGLDAPLAMIGIAEKGYATLTLTATLEEGGHSSMPPKQTAVGILSRAITRLEDKPFPAKIDGATAALFNHVGPEMRLPFKVLFANRWLTKNLLIAQMSSSNTSNALLRTTTAPTMLRGGVKDNVLPTKASAKVNFRIIPGETVDDVVESVRKVINDKRVIVAKPDNPGKGFDPSPISDINAFGFQVIQTTIQQIFPDVVVAPSLVVGGTDARHFTKVSDHIYRFIPIQLSKADLTSIHGINEKISVEGYKRMIRFYRQLILNSCK